LRVVRFMTPTQIRILRRSFEHIGPLSDRISRSFYDRLFEIAPETIGLFGHDEAAQHRLFADIFRHFVNQNLRSMLTLPVTGANNREISLPGIVELWQSQVSPSARPEHFARARDAFVWSLQQHLGGRMEREVLDAWVRAFEIITGAMVDAMRTGARKPVLPNQDHREHAEHREASLELLFSQ
jgi:hemoglobin-like flavoprotein